MGRPGRAAAVLVAVAAVALALLRPPVPWPLLGDRLGVIEMEAVKIDNVRPYSAAERWAPNGSQAGLHLMNPARVAFFDAQIRSQLGPRPVRLLDNGCGGGILSNALARLPGYETIEGVDLSVEALEYATSTAAAAASAARAAAGLDSEVRFQKASLYELPFPDASFDVVVMADVLEHLLDLPRALREADRVLRPGGMFLFDTIDRSLPAYIVAILGAECIVGVIERGTHDWRLFIRPEELRRGLDGVGFKNFTYQAFQPEIRALAELTAFFSGLIEAEAMRGSWFLEPPSPLMVAYIGSAQKPSA